MLHYEAAHGRIRILKATAIFGDLFLADHTVSGSSLKRKVSQLYSWRALNLITVVYGEALLDRFNYV